jgi:hypothetical protein
MELSDMFISKRRWKCFNTYHIATISTQRSGRNWVIFTGTHLADGPKSLHPPAKRPASEEGAFDVWGFLD